jgi:hypothetical protein
MPKWNELSKTGLKLKVDVCESVFTILKIDIDKPI